MKMFSMYSVYSSIKDVQSRIKTIRATPNGITLGIGDSQLAKASSPLIHHQATNIDRALRCVNSSKG